MSKTVYVKINNTSSYPYRDKGALIEAILSVYDRDKGYMFIDSLADIGDSTKDIRIAFADGGGQSMPISSFNKIFTIVPIGALTGVLYE